MRFESREGRAPAFASCLQATDPGRTGEAKHQVACPVWRSEKPQTDTPEDADPIPCTWVTKEKSHKVSNLRSDRYRNTQILAHIIPKKFFSNRIPPLGYEKTTAGAIELANEFNLTFFMRIRSGADHHRNQWSWRSIWVILPETPGFIRAILLTPVSGSIG